MQSTLTHLILFGKAFESFKQVHVLTRLASLKKPKCILLCTLVLLQLVRCIDLSQLRSSMLSPIKVSNLSLYHFDQLLINNLSNIKIRWKINNSGLKVSLIEAYVFRTVFFTTSYLVNSLAVVLLHWHTIDAQNSWVNYNKTNAKSCF